VRRSFFFISGDEAVLRDGPRGSIEENNADVCLAGVIIDVATVDWNATACEQNITADSNAITKERNTIILLEQAMVLITLIQSLQSNK